MCRIDTANFDSLLQPRESNELPYEISRNAIDG